MFLCNFKFGGNCGVVCFFLGLRLSDADVSFGICLGNGGCLADGRRLIDTEIFNHAVRVFEVLDVECLHHDAELFKVRDGVFEHEFRDLLAVAHEVHELHAANNFAHVTFENIDNHGTDVFGLLVQEVLSRGFETVRIVRNLGGHHSIDRDVDVILGGDGATGFHVNLDQLKRKVVGAFEERNAKACTPDDDARLLLDAGNDNRFVRSCLDVGHDKDNY